MDVPTLKRYSQGKIFNNFSTLREDFIPEQIIHRRKELEHLARSIFAPPLRGQPPGHLFVMGTSGTGKTLAVKYWKNELEKELEERGIDTTAIFYVNCSTYPTQWDVA